MTIYKIRIGSRNSPAQPIQETALRQLVTDGIQDLVNIQNECRNALKYHLTSTSNVVPSAYYNYWGSMDRDLKKRGFMQVQRHAASTRPMDSSLVTLVINEIEELIDRCRMFESFIGSKYEALPGYAVVCSNVQPTAVTFNVLCSPKDSCCPKCNSLISAKGLNRHIDSTLCVTRRTDIELLAEKNFVRTMEPAIEWAIVKAGIPFEKRPVTYATWIPKWADEAAKAYKTNSQSSGKFAGLSLYEYLKRMRPDGE